VIDVVATPPEGPAMEMQIDRTVIIECVADGADGVRQMVADVAALAERFTEQDIAAGNHGLARLAQDLKALIVLVQTLREPLSELDAAAVAALPSDQDVEQLCSWLESLVSAQVGRDWLTIADVLRFDLQPELENWLAKLSAVKTACGG
jgi:hypothetical protein